jgi:hypothetical protein
MSRHSGVGNLSRLWLRSEDIQGVTRSRQLKKEDNTMAKRKKDKKTHKRSTKYYT